MYTVHTAPTKHTAGTEVSSHATAHAALAALRKVRRSLTSAEAVAWVKRDGHTIADGDVEDLAAVSRGAATIGRKGGAVRSEAKAKAVRANGAKGGRPAHVYFVVAAPGHYGDRTWVVSSHATLDAARKAAGNGWCVRRGALRKGTAFYRSSEAIYPIAE